jgi:hypothetical protein
MMPFVKVLFVYFIGGGYMTNGFSFSIADAVTDKAGHLRARIMQWLTSPSLKKLVEVFGDNVPDNLDLGSLAEWFLAFSERWDFRKNQKQAFDNKIGEGVRWLVGSDTLTDEQKAAALEAAVELGLRNNATPKFDRYDYLWVLGGAKMSCLLRARFAAQTIRECALSPKAVALLGSTRPIADTEREATETYAPSAASEFDLFVAAAKQEFNLDGHYQEERYDCIENPSSSWIERRFSSKAYDIYVMAAPSSEPLRRRANSADTYEFFYNRLKVNDNAFILLVTSEIYVPYQHLEAVRTIALPHGINLDTIGFPREWSDALHGMYKPSNYLQEIRSTIQSINRLLSVYGD